MPKYSLLFNACIKQYTALEHVLANEQSEYCITQCTASIRQAKVGSSVNSTADSEQSVCGHVFAK